MAKRRLWTASVRVLVAATALLACGDDEDDIARLERDDIDRDLETVLDADTAVSALRDTAVDAPSRRRPQPVVRTVPTGTTFAVYLDAPLSTEASRPGDPFTATLRDPIVGRDGQVLLPSGATVRGRITGVSASDRAGDTAVIKLAFESVSFDGRSHPMRATVVEANPERRTRTARPDSAAGAASGSAASSVAGRILGRGTESTRDGAGTGAAAGTAIALGTTDADAVLPGGSRMVIRLISPVEVAAP